MQFNKQQIEAIEHYEGNCCVMASAGSGKTSVLVNRITNLINKYNVSPDNILAITFSTKAKENITDRICKLLNVKIPPIYIDTFHGLGNKIIKESRFHYQYNTLALWQQQKIIRDIVMKDLHLESNEMDVNENAILAFISHQKNNLLSYNDELLVTESPYKMNIMQEIYKRYEFAKTNEKAKDYDDMLLNTYKLLTSNSTELEKYQDRFKFILVDEFQDTNKAMYEILRLLGKKHNNVFVVGDALQNIYEWNNSNNDYIINFYKDWINTKVIALNINYRSSKEIVELSNKLVTGIKETTHKYYVESVANKPSGQEPTMSIYSDEEAEINHISKQILNAKYNYSDVAILTRTNFMTQAIERGLYLHNIPYEIIGGRSFYDLPEIKDIVSYLRLSINTDDNEAFKQIYNSPNRYLGSVFLNEVSDYASKYHLSYFDSMTIFPRSDYWMFKKGISQIKSIITKLKNKKRMHVGNRISLIRDELEYDKYVLKFESDNNDRNERIENLNRLQELASKYKKVSDFLAEVDKFSPVKDNNTNMIKVMTIHKSKGLEFPIVFMPSVNDGYLPHERSDNINEELRLMYVGMTRAENDLHISSTLSYGGRSMNVSPFIHKIFDSDKIIHKI